MPKTFLVPMMVVGTVITEVTLDDEQIEMANEDGIDLRKLAMDNASAYVTLCYQCAHEISLGDAEVEDDLKLEDVTEKES